MCPKEFLVYQLAAAFESGAGFSCSFACYFNNSTANKTFEDHIFEFKLFLFHLSSNKPHPQKSHLLKSQSVYKEEGGGVYLKRAANTNNNLNSEEKMEFCQVSKKVVKFIVSA